MSAAANEHESNRASLPRIFACCFYDAVLSAGVLFVAATVAVAANGGDAVSAHSAAFRLYLLAAAFPYFGYCWTHSGQTLGMRTWRVRLRTSAGETAGWRHAVLRYLGATVSLAAFGIGFAWVLVDGRRRSWHDMLSGTRLEVVTGQ